MKKCSANAELTLESYSGNAIAMLLEVAFSASLCPSIVGSDSRSHQSMQAFHAQYDLAQTLLPKISTALVGKMSELDGEHLAIVAQIFGAMDPSCALLTFWQFTLSALVVESALKQELVATELVTICWALCKASQPITPLQPKLVAAVKDNVEKMTAQNLSELAWVLSQHMSTETELISQVAGTISPRLHEFNVKELADVAIAFTQLGMHTDTLIGPLATQLELHHLPYLNHLSPGALAGVSWALSKNSLLSSAAILGPLLENSQLKATDLLCVSS